MTMLNVGSARRTMIALVVAIPVFVAASGTASASAVVREATGTGTAGIQGAVDQFRSDLGNPNNLNAPGSQNSGRREINWDGNGSPVVATFATPMTTFANRGATFTTPGSGFSQSPEFGEINPLYPSLFATFSLPRLFAPLNSNVMDVTFNVPGSANVPAAVTGFGAVFTDVDSATSTKLQFYAPDGALLFERFVPASDGAQTLSFLGVSFNAGEVVARVHIIMGNAALGPDEAGNLDVVAMDDFIYAEPVSIQGLFITPITQRLFRTGAFDIVVSLKDLQADPRSAQVRLDGMVVTQQFQACIVHARNAEAGDTFRCPAPRGFLPAGDHVFQIDLTLTNNTHVRNAVRWTIVNAEP
jgi:hypothetical protein